MRSHIPYPTLDGLTALPRQWCEEFKKLEINVVTRNIRHMLYTIDVQPTLIEEIRVAQDTNLELDRIELRC